MDSEYVCLQQKLMDFIGVSDYSKILHDGTTSDVWTATKSGQKVVVKVSDDKSCYKTALRVWQYPSPLIAKVLYAGFIPSGYGYWSKKIVSVEEYLEKLPEPAIQVLDEIRWKMDIFWRLKNPGRYGGRHSHGSATPQRLAIFSKSLTDLQEKRILKERLLPISISLQKRGLVWFDFHGGNIMLRNKTWVMSDLGYCWVRARCSWTDGTAQPTPPPEYCQ